MLEEPRVDLHLALQHGLEVLVHLIPAGYLGRSRRQLRVHRHDSTLLLAFERRLAQGIPAVGELALVLVSPLERHMVRRMRRTRGEVDKEWLVGRERLLRLDPADRTVRE